MRPDFDPSIEAYYDYAPEESRLEHGPSRLEAERTRELILRHAPDPPAVVLDVGGAAGAYSFWLAERGYDVRLFDASARLIDVARSRNKTAARRITSCEVGDARALPVEPDSAEMILMLGPLYHLQEEADRRLALSEALRVLRPGGVLLAAGVSRWGSLLDGLSRELLNDEAFSRFVDRDLTDGRHFNPTDRWDYFTTAYFHRPRELRQEAVDAGFEDVQVYGIEGPGWILPDFDDRWGDPERREMLLRAARALETEPEVIGCSAHLLAVGRKPSV